MIRIQLVDFYRLVRQVEAIQRGYDGYRPILLWRSPLLDCQSCITSFWPAEVYQSGYLECFYFFQGVVPGCGDESVSRLNIDITYLTIIAVYAPIKKFTNAEKDDFYTTCEDITLSVPAHNQLIVAGDFNAVSSIDRLQFDQVAFDF